MTKLILSHDKSKIRKKRRLINQTILPFLRFNFHKKKNNKNSKNMSPTKNTTQLISLAIPEIKETSLNSK